MKRAVASRVAITSLAASVLLITACGKKDNSGFAPATLPSVGDGTTAPIPGKGFGVSIPSTYEGSSYLHLFNDRNAACEIPSTTKNPTEISCLAHVPEGDLFMSGLPLVINYPAGFCKFAGKMPYYYYKYESGVLPGSASMSVTIDSGSRSISGCGGGTTLSGGRCVFPSSEGSIDANGIPTCAYDHSLTGGPNCCAGAYTYSITETTVVRDDNGVQTGTVVANKITTGTYGGNQANCLAGPALSNGTSPDGYPVYLIARVSKNGSKDTYAGLTPITFHGGVRINVASSNFFGWDDYILGNHDMAQRPISIAPGNDRSGSPRRETNEAYTFDCLDEARELKHRINVYIAEWDTNEAFRAYVDSGDMSVSPNALPTDLDGIDCAVGEAFPGSGFCNDFDDWEDADLLTQFIGDVFSFK